MTLIDRLAGTANTCRIAIVQPGTSADSAARAMRFFDSVLWVFKGTARAQWTLVPVNEADVIVVHHQTDSDQLKLWRAAGKYVVVVSTDPDYRDPEADADGLLLSFPFQTADAIALLSRLDGELSSQHQHAPAPAAPAAKVDSVAVVDMLRTLRSAGTGTQWLVGKINGEFVWVAGDGRQYRCAPQTVQNLRAGAGCTALQMVNQAAPPQGLVTRPGSELVWFLAYHAADKLLFDLSTSASLRLLKWPDFGLVRVANAAANSIQMRIVAALDVMPGTVPELVYRASATQVDVVRLINALHASGCVLAMNVPQRPSQPKVAAPPGIAGGVRSFLSNLRKHLGLGAAA